VCRSAFMLQNSLLKEFILLRREMSAKQQDA
jgi:hypothetical protein